MEPNTEAGTALTEGTVEEGDIGTTVLKETDTGIGARGVTSIVTLTGTEAEAGRESTGEGRRSGSTTKTDIAIGRGETEIATEKGKLVPPRMRG